LRLKTDGCVLVRRRVIQRLRSVHPIGPPIARIARHTNGIRGTCDVRHSCRYHDTGQEVNARPTVAQFWHARGRSNPRLRHDGPEFCQKNQHPIQLFRCSNEPARPRVPWAPFVFPPPRPDPPPQFGGLAEPSGANDDADAAAICEAATQPNALCIGRDCDQLVFHRAVAVSLLRCISGVAILPVAREKNSAAGLLLEPKLQLRRLSHPSTYQAGNRRPAGPIDAMRDPGRVDRGLRRRPHYRGGRHRGLHDVTMCQRRSSIYSATGRAPDTDRILTVARSSQASLGLAGNRRSTFENQSKQILERAS
jgi:hypothetical protein